MGFEQLRVQVRLAGNLVELQVEVVQPVVCFFDEVVVAAQLLVRGVPVLIGTFQQLFRAPVVEVTP